MTKKIKLTQGQVALVSDHRFEELNKYRWYAQWMETAHSYYAARDECGKKIYMHRYIANTPKGMIADHVDGNSLNNQDHNLRNVTPSQSSINRGRRKNKSGHKNIYVTPFGKFRVTLQSGTSKFSMNVRTLSYALQVRDQKRKEMQGEYVREGS